MHLTLHVTDACNMSCIYCARSHSDRHMSFQTARAAVDFAIRLNNKNQKSCISPYTGICFFGGEPLLARPLIEEVVAYCSDIGKKTKERFRFIVVTNGTLLDTSFVEFARTNDIQVDLSHDGLMHQHTRQMQNNTPSFEKLEPKIDLLLEKRPQSAALCTVHPNFANQFVDSVEWLLDRGFQKVHTVPAIGAHIDWTSEAINILKKQYQLLSNLYVTRTLRGERFSLPMLDVKIKRHIMQETIPPQSCSFGQKQLSVTPDGRIYPCLQFIDQKKYLMGDVFEGLNPSQVRFVIEEGKREAQACQQCALKNRCKYNCCCQNILLTGAIDKVSALTCSFERMTIEAADRAANLLYEKKDPQFINRHYKSIKKR